MSLNWLQTGCKVSYRFGTRMGAAPGIFEDHEKTSFSYCTSVTPSGPNQAGAVFGSEVTA